MRVTRILLSFCFVTTLALSTFAQGRYNYWSVGGFVGVGHYNGDFTKSKVTDKFPVAQLASIKDNNLAVSGFFTYHFHPHMHVRGSLSYSPMKMSDPKEADLSGAVWGGRSNDGGTTRGRGAEVTMNLYEVAAILVYEFKATNRGYAYRPKLNFYVMGGLAGVYTQSKASQPTNATTYLDANGNIPSFGYSKTNITLAVPFGIGVRYKLAKQWDLRAEAGLRYTLSDKIDGYNTIYDQTATEITQVQRKINDWYSFSGISVSYILNDSERCPTPKRARKKFLFF